MWIVFVSLLFSLSDCDWDSVDKVLENGILEKIYPGCTAFVGNSKTILYGKSFGHHKYTEKVDSPIVSTKSIFDLASLTKVLSTTVAVQQFYERKELNINDKITNFFPNFQQKGKSDITIENCLLHNGGFPPDPTPYWYYKKDFGCPESFKHYPQLSFSCHEKVKEKWESQELKSIPGEKYVYSDISMITLHFVIGYLAKELNYVLPEDLLNECMDIKSETCYYEAYVRKYVFDKLGLGSSMRFRPPPNLKNITLPTWIDDYYRNELLWGVVCDENSYAQGGISGHAGLFASGEDVTTLMTDLMFKNTVLSKETMSFFSEIKNTTQSNRSFGWGTNYFQDTFCQVWSKETYYHTGYTGTMICADPTNEIFTILLTNRCYPDKTGKMEEINQLRRLFNAEVKKAVFPSFS